MQEEHEAIIKRRDNPDSGLTWSEYKSMKFTFQVNLYLVSYNIPLKLNILMTMCSFACMQVINETVRLANIAPVIFRKALEDIKFKG